MNMIEPKLKSALQQHSAMQSTLDDEQENGYFVYNLDKLNQHLQCLTDQSVVKLWYAVKANPLSSILRSVSQSGINFDVASKGELDHVLAQDIEPKRILNTGPAKSKQQLRLFLEKGVTTFVVESINQLQWLQEVVESSSTITKPTVLLRVQLQWPEGDKNPLGGNAVTPFGLGCEQWQRIQVADYPSLDLCGLHIFQWGNMLSNAKMYSLWQQMVQPLTTLASAIGMELKVLDLGGGLGVDYLNSGERISWQQAMSDLADVKRKAKVDELWLELGRYAVADCGYYVSPVVDRKNNFEHQQLVLAAGINHLIRPAITDQPFPASLLRDSNAASEPFDVHGPLCTSLDHLGKLALPNDCSVDDSLVFGLCGAYGFTESMPFFLCHEIAAEYVFEQGKLIQVRAQQPASWYLR
ncbi:PLP-dependent decarboxylase [Thalassotalea atypica]|uniref:PLP-dependent decarboxylase n=1 Tax=Thalassotalea atypica TaxID=2054316 RepID=UPI002573ED16|nr:PLP-dependent decarboxylase [Thalassotalea atypica]